MNNLNLVIEPALSQLEWSILDMLSLDAEPLEIVDGLVKQFAPQSNAADTLQIIFNLYRMGFLAIRQIPVQAFGQSFPKRELNPCQPLDVVGDLRSSYRKFRKTRHYLSSYQANGVVTGIPFGIWLVLAPDGHHEADRDLYRKYWNQWEYNLG